MQNQHQQSGEPILIHGHRGCRGELPENTLPGFIKALNDGVDALELDIVLTANHDVLVSHDPFMHHEICTYPDGRVISEADEMSLNIFQMQTDSVKSYHCGSIPHQRFPNQKQIADLSKPTLKEVVESIREQVKLTGKKEPLWNIEVKSEARWDKQFHPEPKAYSEIFLAVFNQLGLKEKAVIQSFDPRILNSLHQLDPQLKLILLSDDASLTPQEKLAQLNFHPFGFSPNYQLANEEVVAYCKEQKLELIVWTVNEESDIRRMMELGIKNIITDYPQRAIQVRKEQN